MSAALRQQLQLPEKQGLLVAAVMPDSPAAKAGIARHDILWSVGGKPLMSMGDLIRAVERAKTGKMALELIHAGKRTTVDVVPAKRPEQAMRGLPLPPEASDWSTIQKWMEQQWADQGTAGPLHFRIWHPGAILPHEPMPPMPSDMGVVISKQGGQPAKITVTRGDQKWETTENQLQRLPDHVRPYVEGMLGRGPGGLVGIERSPGRAAGAAAAKPPAAKNAPGSSFEDRVEKQLEELGRRVDRIMQSLDQSAQHRSPSKTGGPDQPSANSQPAEE